MASRQIPVFGILAAFGFTAGVSGKIYDRLIDSHSLTSALVQYWGIKHGDNVVPTRCIRSDAMVALMYLLPDAPNVRLVRHMWALSIVRQMGGSTHVVNEYEKKRMSRYPTALQYTPYDYPLRGDIYSSDEIVRAERHLESLKRGRRKLVNITKIQAIVRGHMVRAKICQLRRFVIRKWADAKRKRVSATGDIPTHNEVDARNVRSRTMPSDNRVGAH